MAKQVESRPNHDSRPVAGTPTDQALSAIALLEHRAVSPRTCGCGEILSNSSSGAILHAPCGNSIRTPCGDELVRHLDEDFQMSCFDFALQFLDTGRMTYWGKRRDANFWIENASVNWKETQAPFHTVARLTLLPKSQLAPNVVDPFISM